MGRSAYAVSEAVQDLEKAAYSVDETCVVLGIGRSTVFSLFATGELQSFTIGARRLVPRTAIDDFIARRVAEASGGIDLLGHRLRQRGADEA